jgi:flagellin FlaB
MVNQYFNQVYVGGTMLKRIFKQKRYFKNIYKNQKGITGLETAIILIAFVVVAAVFAYTVLSAGLFSTQKSQEAVYNGLSETQSTMVVKGAVLSHSSDNLTSDQILVTLALSTGGNGVDFTAGGDVTGGLFSGTKTNKIVVNYNDAFTHLADVAWTAEWIGNNNGDVMLDPGEKVTLTISLAALTGEKVDANHQFTLEIKAPRGAMLSLQRTMPARLYTIDNLN